MEQLDATQRATFHHIASQDAVCPTNREIRWLKHIERHGPQSSAYLYELTKNTHRCKDTALRDMQKLRAGGFLSLPPQQRATERAEFNPYIYDLTPNAKRWLADHGFAEPTVRPTGHWWHGFAVCCVTSAIDIAAARDGLRYIPAHEILSRRDVGLGIPVQGKLLVPDQLFALDYGGSYRAFMLEVDRGTEPVSSKAARKSYSSSIAQYGDVLRHGLHRDHYGLKANLLVLWVFTSKLRARRFLELAGALPHDISGRILVKRVECLGSTLRPAEVPTRLYAESWQTGSGSLASIAC